MSGRLDRDSLERLVPDDAEDEATGRETLELHLARYRFAAEHALAGRVLDAACGVGYGTRLLTDLRSDITVHGIDVEPAAVAYARERYEDERTTFECADALRFKATGGFDTVVSLETIEHVPDPGAFVARMVSLVRPGGRFVGSVPTTPSVDVNPHHLHDFTERSFRGMLARHGMREIACLRQVQRVNPLAVVRRGETRMKDARENLFGYYLSHPAALAKRAFATLRFGFTNHYLTVAWERPSGVESRVGVAALCTDPAPAG